MCVPSLIGGPRSAVLYHVTLTDINYKMRYQEATKSIAAIDDDANYTSLYNAYYYRC